MEEKDYKLYSDIVNEYDNNKVYSATTVGTENASINIEKASRGLVSYASSMFIKMLTNIVAYKIANNEEIKQYNTLKDNYNKAKHDYEIDPSFIKKNILDNRTKELKDYDMVIEKDENDKETYLKRSFSNIPRNQLFFNVSKTRSNGSNDSEDGIDTQYSLDDPDYDRFMYKTWIFTNVEDKILHSVDRQNRIGLIQVKKDINRIAYNAMEIPMNAKGVFIVKENVLARPEFNGQLGLSHSGAPMREMFTVKSCASTIRHTMENLNKSNGNNVSTIDIFNNYLPIINTGDSFEENCTTFNNYLFLNPKYGSWYKDPKNRINIYRKTKYLHMRKHGIFNTNLQYASLFYGGVDSKYIRDMSANPVVKRVIDRWESIVRNHYNNFNMKISLDYNKDNKDVTKRAYNMFIKDKVGYLSDYIIKEPLQEKEVDMFRPWEKSKVTVLKQSSRVNYLYDENDPIEPTYRIKEDGTIIDNSEICIDNTPLSYGEFVQLKETFSTYVESYLVLQNNILYNTSNPKPMLSYEKSPEVFSKVNISLNDQATNLFEHFGFFNGISLQDVIFIPIEKIEKNNGFYHDPESDFIIVDNEHRPSTSVIHPGSKQATKDALTNKVSSTGISISIYSNNPNKLGKVYYTKLLNKVITISILNNDNIREGIYVNRNGVDEVFDLTDDNLNKLGIFDNLEDAECNGLREKNLEFMKYQNSLKEQDVKSIVSDNNVEISKQNTEQIKWKIEYEKEVAKNKLNSDLLKFYIELKKYVMDFKQANMKFRFQMEAALNMEMLKVNAYRLRRQLEEMKLTKAQMDIEKSNIENTLSKYKTLFGGLNLAIDVLNMFKS